MEIVNKLLKSKANTIIRVNNTIYAKISDAEDSGWRSAFGVKYANAIINMCRQAENVDFLTENEQEEEKPVEIYRKKALNRRKLVDEVADVREKEPN